MTDEAEVPQETPETEAPSTPKESKPSVSDNWRDRYTGENEKTREFVKRFGSENEMFDWAFQTRQKLSNAIIPPGKDATVEEVAAYRKALGVPEGPDGYELKPIEGLEEELGEEALKSVSEWAHSEGIPKETLAKLFGWYAEQRMSTKTAYADALSKAGAKVLEDFKRERGPEYEADMRAAGVAVSTFGGDELMDLQNAEIAVDGVPTGMRIGDHPAFVKFASTVGRRLGEAGSDVGMSEDRAKELEDEARGLTKKMFEERNPQQKRKLFERQQEIYRMMGER